MHKFEFFLTPDSARAESFPSSRVERVDVDNVNEG
jgi:hypothetical protein